MTAKNQHSALSVEVQKKRTDVQTAENEITNASLGLEHFVREMGQIYEVHFHANFNGGSMSHLKNVAKQLPHLAASMLLNGHPIEIMDGDSCNILLLWIEAVLKQVGKIVGDKKVLVISVLGIQSSGKSTLLNTMFGLQVAVSVGTCT